MKINKRTIKQMTGLRLFPVAIIFVVMASALFVRLFVLQLINGYKMPDAEYFNEVKRPVYAQRGNIYDCNGRLLAYSVSQYDLMMEYSDELQTNASKNDAIYRMLTILKENNIQCSVSFGLVLTEDGKLEFKDSGNAQLRFKKEAFCLRSVDELTYDQRNASPEEVFEFLCKGDRTSVMFNIPDEYSLEDRFLIAAVRFNLLNMTVKYEPFMLAADIGTETKMIFDSEDIPGIYTTVHYERKYEYSEYFAHVIGYTGTDDQFKMTGKNGIELSYDDELSGKPGVETVTITDSGRVVSKTISEEPVKGDDIYLTLDAEYQVTYYHLLEKVLSEDLLDHITDRLDYGTRGESDDDILIPLIEVYASLFSNNVILLPISDSDSKETLSNVERKIVDSYSEEYTTKLSEIDNIFKNEYKRPISDIDEKIKPYADRACEMLLSGSNSVLNAEAAQNRQNIISFYYEGSSTPAAFFKMLIEKDLIDLEKIQLEPGYYYTDEIYDRMIKYVFECIGENRTFEKMIIREMIMSGEISDKDIMELLFQYGIVNFSEDETKMIASGNYDAGQLMKTLIRDMRIRPSQLALEPCSGSIVMEDTYFGTVRALVSYPSYDTNRLANHIDSEYYNRLVLDASEPLYPRATQNRTEIGSTFKMITATAGLAEGVISVGETINDEVEFTKIVPSPSCSVAAGHNLQTLSEALMNSCNYYFFETAYRLSSDNNMSAYKDSTGIEVLRKYGALYGLSETSGIEIYESRPSLSSVDAVRSAIGYKCLFTPVQLSKYISTVANRGVRYKYTLIGTIKDSEGNIIFENWPVLESKISVLTNLEWNEIIDGLESAVEESGRVREFSELPVNVAGKTGTVQLNNTNASHALFVSFAPANNPDISITCVIPNGYEGNYAADAAYEAYRYYYLKDNCDIFK